MGFRWLAMYLNIVHGYHRAKRDSSAMVQLFQIDWGLRVKSARGTIKILMNSDISSDSITFLTIARGGGGGQPNIGEVQFFFGVSRPFQIDLKIRPSSPFLLHYLMPPTPPTLL